MSKFKKGDRVRLIDHLSCIDIPYGAEGTVEELVLHDGSNKVAALVIDWDAQRYNDRGQMFYISRFEKIAGPKKERLRLTQDEIRKLKSFVRLLSR
jgi:hypothetical protein